MAQRLSVITLENLLPEVFALEEGDKSRCDSQVWLGEVSFRRPESYLIAAESGTGKSSLCSYIYGDRRDYKGRILFDGKDIATFSVSQWCELRRRSLAYLPQEMRLFPELTALENVEIKNRLTGFHSRKKITDMLEELELGERIHTPAGRLSVGQQQRVAIIRALCQPFDFLIVDEPVSHLDARNNRAVATLIAREATDRGASVIATTVGNDIALPLSVTPIRL